MEPQEGDVFLLCSDGLSRHGDATRRSQEILPQTPDLEKACAQLIDMANAAGGNDNVTCVLARYHAG